MRRAFIPLALAIVLSGAGCERAYPPQADLAAGEPLPVPPAPPRPPPRRRAVTAEAALVVPPVDETDGREGMPPADIEAMPGLPPPVEPPRDYAILPPGPPVPPVPGTGPTLAALAGLNEAEILGRFGPPQEIATVAQGVRWTWDAEGCEMTLILFPDVAAQRRRVLSAELSGPLRYQLGEAGCLERLGQHRAGL